MDDSPSEANRAVHMPGTERWPRYAIGLLTLYAAGRAIVASKIRPFWLDEIYTWIMAHQPGAAVLWKELRLGIDPQTFLYYSIERFVARLPDPEIALRLPSVAGFVCALACVYVFVHRRSGTVYAFLSAALLMLTALYRPFAIEARPYSLVTACIAVALISYQRVSELRWAGLMALSLALAECLHYYAIFALIPFAAAETLFSAQTSQVRWRVWVALLITAVPLAIFWPNLAHFKALYGANFWEPATLDALARVYGDFLGLSSALGIAVAMVCVFALFGDFFALSSGKLILRTVRPRNTNCDLFRERILIAFLLLTPLSVFIVARLLHGGYTTRYVVYGVLAFPLTAGLVLPRLGRPTLIVFFALLACALMVQDAAFWLYPRQPLWRLQSPATEADALLRSLGPSNLPVVVPDWGDYSVLAHYSSQPIAGRLAYVKAPSEPPELDPVYYPFHIYDFESSYRAHPSFLLLSSFGDLQDWWAGMLVRRGYTLRPLASSSNDTVFLASRPAKSGSMH